MSEARLHGARLAVCFGGILALAIVATGCGTSEHSRGDAGQSTVADPILQYYEELKASHKDSLEQDALLLSMTEKMVAAGKADNEASAVELLIDSYRDHELGIRLLQARLDRLLAQGQEQAIQYCHRIINDHGDAPTAAYALDVLLDCLRNSAPDEYLKKCSETVGGEATRLKKIALLSRINFYHDTGKTKLAALDTLRFWHLYPDKVESEKLKPFFSGNLQRAGWLLEDDVMRATTAPSADAGAFLSHLESVGVEESLLQNQAGNPIQQLYLDAPNTVTTLQRDIKALSLRDQATVFIHCARLELTRPKGGEALPLLSNYLKAVEALLAESQGPECCLGLLNQGACRGLADYIRLYGQPKNISQQAPSAGDIAQLMQALDWLGGLQVTLCQRAVDEPIDSASPCNVVNLADFLEEIGVPRRSADLITSYLDSHPQAQQFAALQMKLGYLQRDKLEQPQKAAETFLKLFEIDPEGPYAVPAALCGAIMLVQQNDHARALVYLQQLASVVEKQQPNYPQLLYLTAVCEHALGAKEDAEARIADLVLNYAGNPTAAKALFWLGSTKLADQEYEEALGQFNELVARYPQTSEAKNAKEYINRLSELQKAIRARS